MGNSIQQASQIGTEESCGRGKPQREHEAGRRAQLKASMGLRSTRATARHREVSDGGTSIVSEPESLRKTHLSLRKRGSVKRCLTPIYTPMTFVRQACESSAHRHARCLKALRQAMIWPIRTGRPIRERIEKTYLNGPGGRPQRAARRLPQCTQFQPAAESEYYGAPSC